MAVYNEKGEKVATIENPESIEGQEVAKKLSDEYIIDYGENNVTDAPAMRENYQLGGLIPGQQGFGKRPIVSPPVMPVRPISPTLPLMEEGGEVPEYEQGKKVKK